MIPDLFTAPENLFIGRENPIIRMFDLFVVWENLFSFDIDLSEVPF